jgi:hypothetical protein
MFERELAFFKAHQDDLVARHPGKVLVLRGETIEGAYHSALEAYLDARRRFDVGTFMIQACEPGVGAYTVMINSNS